MVGKSPEPNCFTCQHRDRTEWCTLSEGEIALLDEARLSRTYGAGEVIYNQGADCRGIFCIESGLVGHRKYDAEGNSALIRICGPGETIGYRSFLLNSEHMLTAEVLMPSRVCFIEKKTVQDLLSRNPALGMRFLRRAASDLSDAEDRYFESVTLSARARVVHMLLVFYQRFGETTATGECVMDLPLSRQDLAALIGIVPESMSRLIRRLEDENVARFDGRRVCLPYPDRLLDEIGPVF